MAYNIFGLLNQRFLIEYFYNKFITKKVLDFGKQTTSILDVGSVELIGPYGYEKMFIPSSKSIVSLSTGVVTDYALYILTGLCLYTLIFMLQSEGINNILDSLVGGVPPKGRSIGAMITILVLILIPSIINNLIKKNEYVKPSSPSFGESGEITQPYEEGGKEQPAKKKGSRKLFLPRGKQSLESDFFVTSAVVKGCSTYSAQFMLSGTVFTVAGAICGGETLSVILTQEAAAAAIS